MRRSLFDLQHQALQVFGFGQVEYDGMIECGATAFEKAHAALRVGSSRGNGTFEIGPADMMRAGTSDQQSARTKHFESA